VVSTWANRIHLSTPLGHGKFGPGACLRQVADRAGTLSVDAEAKHPTWCTGLYCRRQGEDHAHVSTPDRVANLLIALMYAKGEPPVITLTDLTEGTEAATVLVPAEFAGNLAQAVRLTGLRATAAS
jgi:hypothetical protein